VVDLDAIRRRFRGFAETECRGYSDLYYRLALGAAGDDVVMHFLAERPMPQPNLFLAAVQHVVGHDHMPTTVGALRSLLQARGDDVAGIMGRRRTQTNEVGRCAVLVPALPPGPLALVEVGASAGLCLLLDRFSYDYGRARVGPPSAPVRLRCTITGPASLPAALPEVAWRRGLDLDPLDVSDADAVRWLLSCVWADHPDRRRRLEAAIAVARADPPSVVRGDLVDDLSVLLAEAPAEARLVVFHSAVLAYVSPERREAFAGVLARASARREVVWVSNEAPGVVPGLVPPAPAAAELRFVVARMTFTQGARRDEVMALAHPHGSEITWLASPG
jgi:hypothetical protein